MSEKNNAPQRDETELNDESLEEVAGGTIYTPTIPIGPPPFVSEEGDYAL